jgi:hypothetical protein
MPRSKSKKKGGKPARKQAAKLDLLRRGMPAQDHIVKVDNFVSPQGDHYQILKTTETDVYDPKPGAKKKKRKPQE